MTKPKAFDALVIGSGPNGLAAAIELAEKGLKVKVVELGDTPGGGMRTLALTQEGFQHDICSAIHPMAFLSPFFKRIDTRKLGVEWVNPPVAYAQPLEGKEGAAAYPDLKKTAEALDVDAQAWFKLFNPLTEKLDRIMPQILGPAQIPTDPLPLIPFGLKALQPASSFIRRTFKSPQAQALLAGVAAHAIQPLTNIATTAIALVLGSAAHHVGWPIPVGGSQAIADALVHYFESKGGVMEYGRRITSFEEAKHEADIVLFDSGPRQFIELSQGQLPPSYRKKLEAYRYGPGVFKLDIALDAPMPWLYEEAKQAGTVHLGGRLEAIEKSEYQSSNGLIPEDPYVLVAQQSLFDTTRAPAGKHTLWAYMHVPSKSRDDLTEPMLKQLERYAPGFRKHILHIHAMHAMDYQAYNPNYVGGDINAGVQDIRQLFTRPVAQINPYKSPIKGVFLCSSSTPPGGGVHGMCGYHAAKTAYRYFQKNK
jgi:phytoene dehydrogenase-like protein